MLMLKNVDKEKFIEAIEQGVIYVDFDARTGHNHGTKFRIKSTIQLYAWIVLIIRYFHTPLKSSSLILP